MQTTSTITRNRYYRGPPRGAGPRRAVENSNFLSGPQTFSQTFCRQTFKYVFLVLLRNISIYIFLIKKIMTALGEILLEKSFRHFDTLQHTNINKNV